MASAKRSHRKSGNSSTASEVYHEAYTHYQAMYDEYQASATGRTHHKEKSRVDSSPSHSKVSSYPMKVSSYPSKDMASSYPPSHGYSPPTISSYNYSSGTSSSSGYGGEGSSSYSSHQPSKFSAYSSNYASEYETRKVPSEKVSRSAYASEYEDTSEKFRSSHSSKSSDRYYKSSSGHRKSPADYIEYYDEDDHHNYTDVRSKQKESRAKQDLSQTVAHLKSKQSKRKSSESDKVKNPSFLPEEVKTLELLSEHLQMIKADKDILPDNLMDSFVSNSGKKKSLKSKKKSSSQYYDSPSQDTVERSYTPPPYNSFEDASASKSGDQSLAFKSIEPVLSVRSAANYKQGVATANYPAQPQQSAREPQQSQQESAQPAAQYSAGYPAQQPTYSQQQMTQAYPTAPYAGQHAARHAVQTMGHQPGHTAAPQTGYTMGSHGQPMGPQGQPMGPQGQPMGPQGQPMGPQGQPMGPQGQPMGPQGQPTGPQGQPTGPQGQPTGPQGQPMGPQGQPMGPQGQPMGAQGGYSMGSQSVRPMAPQSGYVMGPQGQTMGPQPVRPMGPQGGYMGSQPVRPMGPPTGPQAGYMGSQPVRPMGPQHGQPMGPGGYAMGHQQGPMHPQQPHMGPHGGYPMSPQAGYMGPQQVRPMGPPGGYQMGPHPGAPTGTYPQQQMYPNMQPTYPGAPAPNYPGAPQMVYPGPQQQMTYPAGPRPNFAPGPRPNYPMAQQGYGMGPGYRGPAPSGARLPHHTNYGAPTSSYPQGWQAIGGAQQPPIDGQSADGSVMVDGVHKRKNKKKKKKIYITEGELVEKRSVDASGAPIDQEDEDIEAEEADDSDTTVITTSSIVASSGTSQPVYSGPKWDETKNPDSITLESDNEGDHVNNDNKISDDDDDDVVCLDDDFQEVRDILSKKNKEGNNSASAVWDDNLIKLNNNLINLLKMRLKCAMMLKSGPNLELQKKFDDVSLQCKLTASKFRTLYQTHQGRSTVKTSTVNVQVRDVNQSRQEESSSNAETEDPNLPSHKTRKAMFFRNTAAFVAKIRKEYGIVESPITNIKIEGGHGKTTGQGPIRNMPLPTITTNKTDPGDFELPLSFSTRKGVSLCKLARVEIPVGSAGGMLLNSRTPRIFTLSGGSGEPVKSVKQCSQISKFNNTKPKISDTSATSVETKIEKDYDEPTLDELFSNSDYDSASSHNTPKLGSAKSGSQATSAKSTPVSGTTVSVKEEPIDTPSITDVVVKQEPVDRNETSSQSFETPVKLTEVIQATNKTTALSQGIEVTNKSTEAPSDSGKEPAKDGEDEAPKVSAKRKCEEVAENESLAKVIKTEPLDSV